MLRGTGNLIFMINTRPLTSPSIFGRIIPGILADKFGRFNMQVVMSFLAAAIILAVALPASGNVAFIVFSALYGFASGAFVSLLPAQCAYISKIEQIGVRTGVIFSILSFAGLIGNPIAGAISDHGGFNGLYIFAGVVMLSGSSMFMMTRMYVAKWNIWALV